MARNQHIYFLVHVSRERFKIGRATHPLKRWADLQPHAETDFAASLVFDLDSDVSAGWSERSLHRALRGSRADMPPDRDGHTEWFEYSAFGKARAIARIFRDHLGIGEGYALAAPSVRDAERTTSEGLTARGTRSGTSLEAAALHNDEVATAVESHVSALISSGSILGRARVGERKHLYFDRARISPAEVMLQLDTLIYGPSWSRVFGGARANDRFVRLAIESPFHEPKELDECETARLQNAYSTESRLETTPGFERVRSAILRLIDAASSSDGHRSSIVFLAKVGRILIEWRRHITVPAELSSLTVYLLRTIVSRWSFSRIHDSRISCAITARFLPA